MGFNSGFKGLNIKPGGRDTRWCSWLRYCATRRKVEGLIPDGVNGNFTILPASLWPSQSTTYMNTYFNITETPPFAHRIDLCALYGPQIANSYYSPEIKSLKI